MVLETRGVAIVQENEPGVPAQLMTVRRKPGSVGTVSARKSGYSQIERASTGRLAYFGGVFESGGVELGGVEAGLSGVALLGGVVVSPGAAVVPGAVD